MCVVGTPHNIANNITVNDSMKTQNGTGHRCHAVRPSMKCILVEMCKKSPGMLQGIFCGILKVNESFIYFFLN